MTDGSATDVFWIRVNDHLDRRLDPMDDARVVEYLLRHPELLDEFAGLTSAVASLSGSAATRATHRGGRVRRSAAAVLGIVFLAILVHAAWRFATIAVEEPEVALPDVAIEGAVLGYETRRYTTGPAGRVEHEIEAGSFTILERERHTHVEPRATTPHGFPIRTEVSHRLSRVRAERITQ